MLRVTGKGDKTRVVPVLPHRARGGRALSRALPARARLGRSSVRRRARQAALAPHHPAQASPARAPRSGCRRRQPRMRSAIPSPRICSAPAPTCGRSRSCWATPACRPRKAIPRSTATCCLRPIPAPIPGPKLRPPPPDCRHCRDRPAYAGRSNMTGLPSYRFGGRRPGNPIARNLTGLTIGCPEHVRA